MRAGRACTQARAWARAQATGSKPMAEGIAELLPHLKDDEVQYVLFRVAGETKQPKARCAATPRACAALR